MPAQGHLSAEVVIPRTQDLEKHEGEVLPG